MATTVWATSTDMYNKVLLKQCAVVVALTLLTL